MRKQFGLDVYKRQPFAIYETVYELPNGEVYYDYDDALTDCIKWLQEDVDAALRE